MLAIMKDKLADKMPGFTDTDVHWLIDNIGNESAEIRDKVVFTLLGRGIFEELFTTEQFLFLKNQTIYHDLLFYQIDEALPSTLTRTFAALLDGCIIQADGDSDSKYANLLSSAEKEYFFHAAIQYLTVEHDYTGFSEQYGWVHGFAHGADFLTQAVCHPNFPSGAFPQVLQMLEQLFHALPAPFIDEEERRLAVVVYSAILSNKVAQQTVTEWLSVVNFPLLENSDYFKLACFKSFLAAIYFHLLEEVPLESTLKEALLLFLREY